jgi:hypothetical protein
MTLKYNIRLPSCFTHTKRRKEPSDREHAQQRTAVPFTLRTKPVPAQPAGLHGNTSDLQSGGGRFQQEPGHLSPRVRFSRFPHSLWANIGTFT